MIVLDASTVVDFLLGTPAAARIEKRILSSRETWHAPHLLDLEVAQVLRRYVREGEIKTARGRQALEDLMILPLSRYPHDVLLPRIWELRQNVTTYDAAYVALAELLEAPLLTRDARLASVPGLRAEIEVVQ